MYETYYRRHPLGPYLWSPRLHAARELCDVELPLPDLLHQLYPADRHCRIPKALEAEHRINALFNSPVILLDEVVQVLTRPDFCLWAQHPTPLELRGSSVSSGIAVERYSFGSAVPLNRFNKELPGRSYILVLAQQEINSESLLIDGAIEVRPSPSDSDVRFVHTP